MAINTTFIDFATIATADWLNNVNQVVNDIFDVKTPTFGAKGNGIANDANAINNAIAAAAANGGGIIFFPPGTYNIGSTINITHSHISIKGAGQNTTILNFTGTNNNGIVVQGTSGSPVANTYLSDFNIVSSTQGTSNTGIFLQYTALARVANIQAINFFQGIFMQRATNTFFDKVGASFTSNNCIGWAIDGGGTGAGGNASSTFRDCYVSGTAGNGGTGSTGQIGYRASGAYVSDLYFSNCSTAFCNYGYFLDYTGSAAEGYADVIIHNPVVDGFNVQGILVQNMPVTQKLTIIGGWIDSLSLGTETDCLEILNSAGQVSVQGTQFQGEGNPNNVMGVRVVTSNQVNISHCKFTNCSRAIWETSVSNQCVYSNNLIYNDAATPAANMIYLQSSNGGMITGNSFAGYAASTVLVDNASAAAGVIGNTLNSATLTSPRITNNATTAVGGVTGSTGLNIGF